MAEETAYKTARGVLNARMKIGEVLAFLRDTDAEDETAKADLRLCTVLASAFDSALDKFDRDITDLRFAKRPSAQMTLDDVIKAASQQTPLHSGDVEALTEATGLADDLTADELVDLLDGAQPKRGWTLGAVLGMTSGERRIAAQWAREGGEPVPATVSRVILEDLDPLAEPADLRTLLSWVGVEIDPGTAFEGEDATAVIEWAALAHRYDRGETDLEVPDLPEVLAPELADYQMVLKDASATDEVPSRESLILACAEEQPMARYIVDALIAEDYLDWYKDQGLSVQKHQIPLSDFEKLHEALLAAARRSTPEVVDAD